MIDRTRLLNQLKADEGFVGTAYWDKKQWSYGYGCRAPGENATITEPLASKLVEQHMELSIADFQRIFKEHLEKFNDVRAECFVNLIFNMGPGRPGGSEGLLSFKNTLGLIFNNREVPWGAVADNLQKSLWFRQVGARGVRIVKEVRTGEVKT